MAEIIARDVSLFLPLVGSDGRFADRSARRGEGQTPVGGRIVRVGKTRGVLALDSVNLHLTDGDRLGIFGHNGAGKSTLLRVLAGIYPPSTGELSVTGRVIGMYTLGIGINKELSGLANIFLKGTLYGLRRPAIEAIVPDILEFSGLGDYIHMPVKTYSAGMSLRLQFSIASALKPDILIMDEWISTADSSFRERMEERMEAMIEETPIVVIASHNAARLKGWANRFLHLEGGRVVENADTSGIAPVDFKPDPEHVVAYQRLLNFKDLDGALAMVGTVWPEDRDPAAYHARRAVLLLKLDREAEAEAAYRTALALRPDDPKLHDQFGRLQMRLGNPELCAHHIQRALDISSQTVGDLSYLAKAEKQIAEREARSRPVAVRPSVTR